MAENYLKSLALQLHPSQEEIKQGKIRMDELFELLKTKSRYSIDRTELVGSTAKKTSIPGHIDFDCVVVVNGDHSTSDIVDDFEDIILGNTEVEKEKITKTPRRDPKTLQLRYKDFDFDISVFKNQATLHKGGKKAHQQQAKQLYERYSKTTSSRDMYRESAGLSKMGVDFMTKQSSFVHDIARLAKFWNKTLFLELEMKTERNVSGRSTIMELIGVSAAKEEEENTTSNSRSYINAFRRFLGKVRDISRLKIDLTESSMGRQQGPPYLIDPANPFHNYLEGVENEIKRIFTNFARETLNRLDVVTIEERSFLPPSYEKLFEIQPFWKNSRSVHLKPENWLIGSVGYSSMHTDLKFNACGNHLRSARDVGIMELYLKEIVMSIRSKEGRNLKDIDVIKKYVQDEIDDKIIGRRSEWVSTNENHDSRMATITVPVPSIDGKALRISCNWKSTSN